MGDVSCTNCGHKNSIGSRFCSSCGAVIESSMPSENTTITFHPTLPADGPEAVDSPDAANDEIQLDGADLPSDLGVLVVKRGQNAGSRFTLTKATTTAGRHPESDIFLDDVTVSRRHVEIVAGPNGFLVRDIGSLNGTYLNRERIDEAALANGDELQIGKFKLVFLLGGPHGQ